MDFWTDLNRLSVKLLILSSCFTVLTCFSVGMAQAPTSDQETSKSQEMSKSQKQQTPASANAQTVRQPKSLQRKSLAEVDPAIVNDIMGIRNSLGGGLSQTFDRDSLRKMGLGSLETEFASGFKSALEEVATQGTPTVAATTQDPSAASDDSQKRTCTDEILPACGKLAVNWDPGLPSQLGGLNVATRQAIKIAAMGGKGALGTPVSKGTVSKGTAVSKAYTTDEKQGLRDVARKLDQLSADLEDLEQFSFADQLRSSAEQMRMHARTPFTAENIPDKEKTIFR